MTKEDKQLLLKDLCARLPYNTQGEGVYEDEVWHNGFPCRKKITGHVEGIDHMGFDDEEIYVTIEGIQCELCDVKLYLRPMSSMTEEEKKSIHTFIDVTTDENYSDGYSPSAWYAMNGFVQYCDSRYLDHRGLITKGLALEAQEVMYK